jgi:hypothetical protein
MSTGLSLATRKNIRDEFDNKKGELESKFSTALGVSMTVGPVDWANIVAELDKWANGGKAHDWKERVGEGAFKVIEGFCNNIERIAGSDEMVKEAILEKVSKHQISFKLVETLPEEFYYNGYNFQDGVLYLIAAPSGWPTNVGDTGKDIEKFL